MFNHVVMCGCFYRASEISPSGRLWLLFEGAGFTQQWGLFEPVQRNRESTMNIFVGNLSYRMQENELEAAFAQHGEVQSAKIILDRETGRSRGFGFVEMPLVAEGRAAIEALNGQDIAGRNVVVNEAKPRQPGGPRRRD